MTTMTLTPAAADAVARWTDPTRRPLFKGKLIDADGCACAQGDVLMHNGFTAGALRDMAQSEADAETAKLLGISVAHSILLRSVNDDADGAPESVLTNPRRHLGDQAHIILAFWLHLDRMTDEQWSAARWVARWAEGSAARSAAGWAAWSAAESAARSAARSAAGSAAWSAAGWAARWAAELAARSASVAAARWAAWSAEYACAEIQGAEILRANGTPFYFLPMFGFADPEAVLATAA